MLGVVGQIPELVRILVQVEKLVLGPGMVSLYDGGRLGVGLGGGIPRVPVGTTPIGAQSVGMIRVVRVRSQVVNILVLAHADAANGKGVHLLVAGVGREDPVSMGFRLTKQHRSKGFPVDAPRDFAARQVDEGGQNIHPTDHGVGPRARLDLAGP